MPNLIELPEDFRDLFTPSRYKGFYGGRGSGKSRSFCRAALIKGTQKPTRILCCREIQKSIKDSVKRVLDDDIERMGLQNFYRSTRDNIFGRNGTVFIFAGLRSNIESIKSMEGIDLVLVEESNTISQYNLDQLIPTIREDNSELWFCWNPRHSSDPVDAMFRDDKGNNLDMPGAIIKQVNHDGNPWFPQVLNTEMEWCKSRDMDKYLHVWEGGYLLNGESRVFKNWKVEPFDTPTDAIFYFGADWGFSIDPSVLVRMFIKHSINPDTGLPLRQLFIDYEAWAVGCEIDDTPELFDNVPLSRKYRIRADSARPETISHMVKKGFRVVAATKGPGSVVEGVTFIQNYEVVIHPRCRHVAEEFQHYSYKTDPLTDEVIPILEDKKNHTIDAVRYALEQVRLKSHFAV